MKSPLSPPAPSLVSLKLRAKARTGGGGRERCRLDSATRASPRTSRRESPTAKPHGTARVARRDYGGGQRLRRPRLRAGGSVPPLVSPIPESEVGCNLVSKSGAVWCHLGSEGSDIERTTTANPKGTGGAPPWLVRNVVRSETGDARPPTKRVTPRHLSLPLELSHAPVQLLNTKIDACQLKPYRVRVTSEDAHPSWTWLVLRV